VSPSLGSVTCDCAYQTLAGRGYARVVTTGWRRVVTTLLAQTKLPTIGAYTESLTGADANDDAIEKWLTKISSLAAAGLQEMRPV
jgi:hypothetical protein